ncbi:putative arabinogalactan endo-beta-1 [Lasiodiplodia hormozganensis]|uniref:Arabinogalactan endo-beta-1,4-galactanase n=1 Tax=Lasiodiplodia hormozganensis TaxID=869390 RepID=A0AA40CN88_9PEZI|nr:putative arabinogalactan endo-beta-1 [Lasiodiplodia hormozganensis]
MLITKALAVGSFLLSGAAAAPKPAPVFYKGHDLSVLKIMEEGGVVYHDTAKKNVTRPAEDILGDGGMNTVRLRLWVDPIPGQYDLPYVLDLAKRFASKGYHIYLDYHFSDTWADPQHNNAPAAWPTTLPELSKTIRSYVNSTLHTFKDAGVDLSIVSLGNEIRHGMVWPLGYVEVDTFPDRARAKNFTGLATIYSAARRGVDDAVTGGVHKPDVMIHVDNGWNVTLQEAWFSALTDTGLVTTADWDVFGFSFYPFYGTAATFKNLKKSLTTMSRKYKKPVQVVETDYPVLCSGQWGPVPDLSEPSIPVSVDGQIDWVHKVIDVVRQVPQGRGTGVHYWEPAWTNLTSLGSACDDAILFQADYSAWPTTNAYSRKSVNMFNY